MWLYWDIWIRSTRITVVLTKLGGWKKSCHGSENKLLHSLLWSIPIHRARWEEHYFVQFTLSAAMRFSLRPLFPDRKFHNLASVNHSEPHNILQSTDLEALKLCGILSGTSVCAYYNDYSYKQAGQFEFSPRSHKGPTRAINWEQHSAIAAADVRVGWSIPHPCLHAYYLIKPALCVGWATGWM